jgi:alpha-aminoadipate carrier protein LysW
VRSNREILSLPPPGIRPALDLVASENLNIIRGVIQYGGIMVSCPECETDLDIEEDEVDEGEIVSCPECGSDFEIITINPIELKPVEEEELDEEEEEEAEDGDYS